MEKWETGDESYLETWSAFCIKTNPTKSPSFCPPFTSTTRLSDFQWIVTSRLAWVIFNELWRHEWFTDDAGTSLQSPPFSCAPCFPPLFCLFNYFHFIVPLTLTPVACLPLVCLLFSSLPLWLPCCRFVCFAEVCGSFLMKRLLHSTETFADFNVGNLFYLIPKNNWSRWQEASVSILESRVAFENIKTEFSCTECAKKVSNDMQLKRLFELVEIRL